MQSARPPSTSAEPSSASSMTSLEERATSSWSDVVGTGSAVSCDVVVIGAGIAGLTAAHEILKRDPTVDLCVLEAKDRVGGRTFSTEMRVRDGKTETFDLGGQWVGTVQTDIMETLTELGLEVYPQYIKGTKYMQLGGERIRTYRSTIPNLGSWWGLVQLQLFIWKVDRLARRCSPLSPCRDKTISKLDGHTADSFARSHISNEAALEAIDSACKVIFGCDSTRVSLLHFLVDVHAAGGLTPLLEATPGSAQEFKVKGGTQQISKLLAARVGEQRLLLREPVTRISQEDGTVTVTTGTGRTFHCEYVISSMPPNQLINVEFRPPLSPDKQQILRGMPIGHLIKFVVTFEEPFWRSAGFSGEVVTGGGAALVDGCQSGPLCIVYDATSSTGSAALVGFIAGSVSVDWQKKTKSDREQAVVTSLAQFFGNDVKRYIEYQEKVWAEEPYVGGCPVCFAVPGVMRTYSALRQPHGNVYFCGTELATRWVGFMSGAVQTGREMAAEVLHVMRPGCLSVADLHLINRRSSKRADVQSRLRLAVEDDAGDWMWRAAAVTGVAVLLVWVGRRCLEGVLC
ncbi:probable flavin-containing monoamine oxidase A [Pollicipes pollicipes]|uniref:probable flavin-containing monoamine oxidase A n=1 Tax=Pollicipes pollicipes TaxID=41117 RepID=UPI001884E338|nr:probable flavin-containing monoamine oxidase A [Pollicipes pollicipes]